MPRTELPEQVGRYRIVRKLGEGGMGAVYLAEDAILGRRVAIKVPLLDSAADIQRFTREARVAAAIEHPNICPIHDIGEIEGIHYLIMPFIEGRPLSEMVAGKDRPSPRRIVEVVQKIALALQSMHDRGLMHRDLKPANVLVKPGNDPIIMDFGLARGFRDSDQRLTSTGAVIGTPAYMSPEQLNADPKAMGPATDIYSLGVILYELLAGRTPFQAPTLQAVYKQIFFDTPPPPSTLQTGLDAELDAICLKAMARSLKDRYATMAEFAAALDRWLRKAPTLSEPEVSASGEIRISCPHCGVKLRMPAFARGRRLKCSACKTPFVAPDAGPPTPVPTRPPSASTPVPTPSGPAGGSTEKWPASERRPGATPPPAGRPASPTVAPPGPRVPAPEPLTRQVTNSIGTKLVLIPGGTFLMGSPKDEKGHGDDEWPHEVEITRSFYIGAHAVTQAEFARVMSRNPSWFSTEGGGKDKVAGLETHRLPVESVSWNDAQEYCRMLSDLPEEKRAGRMYRLPSEAEWEIACRAGTSTPFHFGATMSAQQANFDGRYPYGGAAKGTSLVRPHYVGSYPPNAFGLHDMHGNVWEWCIDWYDKDYYKNSPRQDPSGPAMSPERCRLLRGGSWGDGAQLCRSACRVRDEPGGATIFIGFRVVMTTGSLRG